VYASFLVLTLPTLAAVPQLINHQGRIAVNGTNFEGTGQFKFALVNSTGAITYWSNDGSSTAGSQPTAAVSLPVVKGLYAVLLGDAGMTALPASVFENADVRLRVWFNDGVLGFQQITPDQRLAAAPFALNAAQAESVPDGSITGAKLASGLTLGGTTSGTFSGNLTGNASTATSTTNFSGSLAGDVTGTQSATAIAASTVTGKVITGFVSGAGSLTATDTILTAINKLDGNLSLRAPLASPTFTGTVTGTFSGNGSALTGLNGANIATGTLGSAQISDLSIVNADVSPSAAIADTKLATISSAGKVANSATTATTSNTPNALVLRDGSGNFSAGTITGTFVGDGSGLTGVNATEILLQDVIATPIRPVVAWGDNDNGQTSVPTTLINANTAAIATGGSVAVALLKTGTVVQWGSGAAVPSGLTNVTHIAAGTTHRLARKNDGTVTAWGDNTYGQSTVPVGLTTATNVAAGEKHSLALRADGTVLAWGDNTFGQTAVPGTATNVIAIACGYDHSLALKADGSVIAWGRDDSGQSTVPGSLTNVVAIAAGAFHSLAVRADGTVVAWGWDGGGQVAGAAALTSISKVAGGYAFSLALKNDGTLVAFGDNTDGQLNIGAEAVNVTAIAAGPSHALALRADLIPAQIARLDQDNVFTGKVGIRRDPAANALEVEGQASKTTAGNWLANSDRRIKDKVKPITGALEKISKVRLVDFNYTADYIADHPGIEDKRYLNVIAQEFAEVFPEDVTSSGETLPDGSPILQVDTYPLTIYSAAAVQELAKENEKLKKQLADQESRLKKLEEAIK
jgi:Chaperone of endosialidase/Regulator of chromosome condensation (RCC1) repeat